MGKVVGIDLGTTNSVIAVVIGGEPQVIPNAEGSRLTPSVVAFTKTGERLVGQMAKRQAILNPENTVYSIKRFMGRRYSEVETERKMVPYKVEEGGNGMAVARLPAAGKVFTPEEISAMILQKMKADAEAYLGEPVAEAVITVPAYFNEAAHRHQERRRDRRAEGAADHQRADRILPGLWTGQEKAGDDSGFRPGRRHLRRVGPRDRRGRV